MMNGAMMGAMGLWMFLVVLTVLAVLVAAVLTITWLARDLRQNARGAAMSQPDGANDALRQRYAAGEIDDDEYERRLAALGRR